MQNGECLNTLKDHKEEVNTISLTSNSTLELDKKLINYYNNIYDS